MTLTELNTLEHSEALREFERVCGSRRWCEAMVAARPFKDPAALYAIAERSWSKLGPPDWLEAFSHHPRIGDANALREKWTRQEQSGASGASETTLQGLLQGNRDYEARFGHIFLICATGKSADEMLAALRARLANPAEQELRIAAGEQAKITRIRLEKLLS